MALSDRQDLRGDAFEENQSAADRQGKSGEQNAGAKCGDERADVQLHCQDAVDDADHKARGQRAQEIAAHGCQNITGDEHAANVWVERPAG